MPPTNVLFLQSQSYFGSDSMIHALIMRHLDRQRFRMYVACNAGSSDSPSASLAALTAIPDLHIRPTDFGVTVHYRSRQAVLFDALQHGPATLASLSRLAWYIRRQGIAIIHGTEKPRDAFYGLLLSRLTGARCVIHVHVKAELWISPLVRWAMRHADALIGVSPFVARSLVDLGYAPTRIFSVVNAIEASQWDFRTDGSGVRREFGIPAGTALFSIISRLFVWKGHTDLVKALAKVKEVEPNFRLLIVGADDPRANPGGGSYSAEIGRLIEALGMQEHVIFTGFRRDIAQILAASDVFTMPSFEEPCAVAYLEAMAMKVPVIALNSGGTPELVEHGETGFLSLPKDIDQLATNILSLMRNPELRRRMGEHGRERVERYFTPRRLARDVERVYLEIL